MTRLELAENRAARLHDEAKRRETAAWNSLLRAGPSDETAAREFLAALAAAEAAASVELEAFRAVIAERWQHDANR
jgi:hypothetical protein